jgi:ABC-type cobalamin transport system permease subunit
MAVPSVPTRVVLVLSALLITALLQGVRRRYMATTFLSTFVVVALGVLVILWSTWYAVIYPYFLSPFRHLPRPKVNCSITTYVLAQREY